MKNLVLVFSRTAPIVSFGAALFVLAISLLPSKSQASQVDPAIRQFVGALCEKASTNPRVIADCKDGVLVRGEIKTRSVTDLALQLCEKYGEDQYAMGGTRVDQCLAEASRYIPNTDIRVKTSTCQASSDHAVTRSACLVALFQNNKTI